MTGTHLLRQVSTHELGAIVTQKEMEPHSPSELVMVACQPPPIVRNNP